MYQFIMTSQVDVASGSLHERKEFFGRILPFRSGECFLKSAPPIYHRSG